MRNLITCATFAGGLILCTSHLAAGITLLGLVYVTDALFAFRDSRNHPRD